MSETVKVGNKGRHVHVPEGWHRVLGDDVCKVGDRFCNLSSFRFSTVEQDDIGDSAEHFDLLIRKNY